MQRPIQIHIVLLLAIGWLLVAGISGCAMRSGEGERADADVSMRAGGDASAAPPRVQAWMDRLTVEHAYDPETGFIVAREVIDLPPVLRDGPTLAKAVERGRATGRPVVAFATADRCAPCQQFKKDALNDQAVVDRLRSPSLIATHIEVDRSPAEADRYLGGGAIPMTYLIVDGQVTESMPGQRSAADLLAWLDEHLPGAEAANAAR